MIRIETNSKSLDLGNISIQMKFMNPMFSDKPFNEGFSFGFKIPETEKNRSILNNRERFDSKTVNKKLSAKFYFKNVFMFGGAITVKGVSNKEISCYFNDEGLDLTKELDAINLRDLDLETVQVSDVADTPAQKQLNWFSHLQYLLLLNNTEDISKRSHLFPPIHSPKAYDSENAWYSGFINFYWYDEQRYSVQNKVTDGIYATDPGFQTTISPCSRFVYVLKKSLEQLGFSIDESELLATEEIKRMFIYSLELMDQIESNGSQTFNTYGDSYSLQNYLPDVSALELFKALKTLYNAMFFQDGKKIRAVSGKDLLNEAAEDWTNLSEEAYFSEYRDLFDYKFSWGVNNDDEYRKLFAEQFESATVSHPEAIEEVEYKSETVSPLATRSNPRGTVFGSYTTGETWVYVSHGPVYSVYENKTSVGYDGPGRSPVFVETSPEEVSKKLLVGVYRGEDFYSPDKYPSSSNQSIDDVSLTMGEQSVHWFGDDGLVKNYFEEFVEYSNGARPFTVNLFLPPHKIAELARWENIKKKFRTKKGNITGILKEFSVTFTHKGISPVNAQFITKD